MSSAQQVSRYDSVAIALHWTIAALLIANIALGLYFGDLPRSDPSKFLLAQTHKSIGLTVLVLTLARIGWRLTHRVPGLPPDMPALLKLAARGAHVLLYVVMLGLPLTGWAMVSSSPLGLPTKYFGLFDWPNLGYFANQPVEQKRAFIGAFHESHEILANIAIALIILHVGAALYHQFVRRDGVAMRMLGRSS
ncbi:MAG: cytochrome b [Alphaproteobacteria bacterium]|nr:cytochrome b [Alphaproteobacteria bacterium]